MKLITLASSIAVASLAIVSNAYPLSDANIFKREKLTCPVDVLSCSEKSKDLDSCCVPNMGLMVLTQQWVPGYGPPTEFTMQGLWCNTCSGHNGPQTGCDHSRDYKDIETRLNNYPGGTSLIKDLHKYWPSNKNDDNKYWAYQWRKHGTCVSNIAPSCMTDMPMNHDLYTYFKKAIELRSQYNLYQVLAEAGILPGSKPRLADIQAAIKAKFGVEAEIHCKSGVLKDIRLYFNVKNGFNDFVAVAPLNKSSCGRFITYPKKTTSDPTTTSVVATTTHHHMAIPTTAAPGSVPTGIQKSDCSMKDANVCVKPDVLVQDS